MSVGGFIVQVSRLAAAVGTVAEDLVVDLRERHGKATWFEHRCFMAVYSGRTTADTRREPQPIITRSAIVSFLGEIDDRQDIVSALGHAGQLSASDGQILSEAYAVLGRDFPQAVAGPYCFALVDRRDGSLIAGRDALGVTGLYYYEDSRTVLVSSALSLIVDALPTAPPLDRWAIVEYLAEGGTGQLRSGRTVYRGIRQVPPAHLLVQQGDHLAVRRYWKPNPENSVVCSDPAEYDQALRTLLTDAVRSALRAGGPVCCDVSGGLDSSTVTAFAARAKNDDESLHELLAYRAVATETAASDEQRYQRDVLLSYPL